MKKHFAALFVIFAFATQVAFAEKPVPPVAASVAQQVPTTVVNVGTQQAPAAQQPQTSFAIPGFSKLVELVKSLNSEVTDKKAGVKVALAENKTAMAGVSTRLDSLRSDAKSINGNIDKQSVDLKNFLIILGLAIASVIAIGLAAVRSSLGNLINRRSGEVQTHVSREVADVRSDIAAVPAAVKRVMHTLETNVLTFHAGGHEVIYKSPEEWASEGFYLLLHVKEGAVGNPETIERDRESSPGVARRSCASTMRKYFDHAFDGKGYEVQLGLIKHLIETGAIVIRKID